MIDWRRFNDRPLMALIVLGLIVPGKVTPEQLKAAYREKSKEAHPDKPGGNADRFKLIKKAYDVVAEWVRPRL